MLHLWADCSVGLGGALQILLLLLLTLTVTAEFVVRRLFTSSIDSTQCSSMMDPSRRRQSRQKVDTAHWITADFLLYSPGGDTGSGGL